MDQQPRERLGSRLGFLLLSAGCAIGVGNVWKFPTITGQNGGGFFVLFYFLFLIILGIPVLTMEFSLGRAAQKSPVRLYHELTPKGSPFRAHGYLAFLGNIILMMFYTPVSAWMVIYFFYMVFGKFSALSEPAAITGVFGEMVSNHWLLIGVCIALIAISFFLLTFSLQNGLEKSPR